MHPKLRQTKQLKIPLHNKKKSILLFDQISVPNSKNSNYLITTLDQNVYFFSIGNNQCQQDIIFTLKSVGSSACYDDNLHLLTVGCLNGSIYHCNVATQKLEEKYYLEMSKQRPQIICIYVRNSKIFAWNLNSQVTIIGFQDMQLQNRLKFPYDITATLSISNTFVDDVSGCIAFSNGLPPFIFDCDTPKKMIEVHQLVTRDHEQYEQFYQYEVYLITVDKNRKKSNRLICFGLKHQKQHVKSSELFIYSIETVNNYKFCELQLRIEMEDYPLFSHINDNMLACTYWKNQLVYDLERRKTDLILQYKKCVWFFLINCEKERQIRFLICQGMNTWEMESLGIQTQILVLTYKRQY